MKLLAQRLVHCVLKDGSVCYSPLSTLEPRSTLGFNLCCHCWASGFAAVCIEHSLNLSKASSGWQGWEGMPTLSTAGGDKFCELTASLIGTVFQELKGSLKSYERFIESSSPTAPPEAPTGKWDRKVGAGASFCPHCLQTARCE